MPLNLNHHNHVPYLLLYTAIANLFNRYFKSVFKNDDENPLKRSSVMSSSPSTSEHFDLQLTTEEVPRALLALDSTKATGPDEISCRLLKDTAYQIAPSLNQIFNKSLCLGEIPDEWKLANIVPKHKKGDKNQVENLCSFHSVESTGTMCPQKYTRSSATIDLRSAYVTRFSMHINTR